MQVSVIEHAASEIRFIILFSHPCSDEFLWSEHSAGNHSKESHFTMLAKNQHFCGRKFQCLIYRRLQTQEFWGVKIEMKDIFFGDF